MRKICLYAGSSFGVSADYAAVAKAFGTACGQRGLGLVYGGGRVGLMGVAADAALAAGGKVTGIIPRAMIAEERQHLGLTELIIVESMHERKYRMAELADAFIALPGGVGTLEEVTEVFTWLQLGLHLKPVGLLNAHGYYDPLLAMLERMRDQGFLTPAHHAMLTVDSNVEGLLERLMSTQHQRLPKPVNV